MVRNVSYRAPLERRSPGVKSLESAVQSLVVLSGILSSLCPGCALDWTKSKVEDAGAGDGGLRDGGGSADPDADITQCRLPSDCGDPLLADCIEGACISKPPPDRAPSSVVITAGGGTAATSAHRVRVSVGAPVPMGTASTSKYRVTLGPEAGRP